MLSKTELIRYQRQLQLKEFGSSGQQKLKQSKVLVIGAGGLGCAILQYLAAAGVGHIGIVDFDRVNASNLHRQVLYTTEDIGKLKVDCAIRQLSKQNEFIELLGFSLELSNKNAIDIFSAYDIIIDGTDNYTTRYMINDACILLNKPLIYGAIYRFEGQVSVFNYTSKANEKGPTYRCLFPEPPSTDTSLNCSVSGVLGVLPGIIGIMQANETIKIITGIGDVLSGRLMVINTLSMQTDIISFDRNKEAIAAAPASQEQFKNYDYELFCSSLKS